MRGQEEKMAGLVDATPRSATPEQLSPGEGLSAFFGWAEKAHPLGAQELVGVIRSLMPESGKAVTEREIRKGLTDPDLDMGFNVLSSWLGKVTGKGFRDINWPKDEAFLAGAKIAKGISFPAKEKVSSREVQETLKSFSATMKKAEAKGMRPIQIVGNLLRESVGSKLTNNGSITLRGELARALGGDQNLRWLRGALEIKDVAETKPAVEPKKPVDQPEVSPAEKEFQRKRLRIRRYLTDEGGMDFLARSWDENKWEHIGDDGSVKRVYRPLRGILASEKVCVRKNISDQVISYRESAPLFRP